MRNTPQGIGELQDFANRKSAVGQVTHTLSSTRKRNANEGAGIPLSHLFLNFNIPPTGFMRSNPPSPDSRTELEDTKEIPRSISHKMQLVKSTVRKSTPKVVAGVQVVSV